MSEQNQAMGADELIIHSPPDGGVFSDDLPTHPISVMRLRLETDFRVESVGNYTNRIEMSQHGLD